MDYTGVGNNHPCFHCSDPKPKPCVCKLNFTIDFFLKVTLELCTNVVPHTRTNGNEVELSSWC